MTNLGAGNRLALAAGLRDWCKVLCCTLFSNIRKILRIFTNLRKILRMLLIGVKLGVELVAVFVPAVSSHHDSIRDAANGTGVGPDQ